MKHTNKLFIFLMVLFTRLPFALRDSGHYDSEYISDTLNRALTAGYYIPSRHPGSPVAELIFSLARTVAETINISPHFLTNLVSIFFTTGIFLIIHRSLLSRLSQFQSWAILVLINFHPQMLIFGGATSDVIPGLFFGALAVRQCLDQKVSRAILFGVLATLCRIQFLAVLLPILALWTYRGVIDISLLKRGLVAAGLLVLVWIPGFSYYGTAVFSPGVHAVTIESHHKLGGFLYRLINNFGPIGFGILTWVFFRYRFWLSPFRSPRWLYLACASLTLGVFLTAPWEAFYLLPFTLIAISAVGVCLLEQKSKVLIMAFALSIVSSNIYQIRIKPWKPPFFEVLSGTISAHFSKNWVLRGGG